MYKHWFHVERNEVRGKERREKWKKTKNQNKDQL